MEPPPPRQMGWYYYADQHVKLRNQRCQEAIEMSPSVGR